MSEILKAVIRFILGRYAPKWAAALEAGQAAYAAADQQEQEDSLAEHEAKIKQLQAGVEARKEKAHAQVVSAADPDAVVNQQLRDQGIITDD